MVFFVCYSKAVIDSVNICLFARKCSEGMAKKRPKAQKNNDVFKVANSRSIKAKNKTKHVTTSLKKVSKNSCQSPMLLNLCSGGICDFVFILFLICLLIFVRVCLFVGWIVSYPTLCWCLF